MGSLKVPMEGRPARQQQAFAANMLSCGCLKGCSNQLNSEPDCHAYLGRRRSRLWPASKVVAARAGDQKPCSHPTTPASRSCPAEAGLPAHPKPDICLTCSSPLQPSTGGSQLPSTAARPRAPGQDQQQPSQPQHSSPSLGQEADGLAGSGQEQSPDRSLPEVRPGPKLHAVYPMLDPVMLFNPGGPYSEKSARHAALQAAQTAQMAAEADRLQTQKSAGELHVLTSRRHCWVPSAVALSPMHSGGVLASVGSAPCSASLCTTHT